MYYLWTDPFPVDPGMSNGWRVQRLDVRGRPLAGDPAPSPPATAAEDAGGVGTLAGASSSLP